MQLGKDVSDTFCALLGQKLQLYSQLLNAKRPASPHAKMLND